MKIGTWTAITLFGVSLLFCGCYGSSGAQAKDGQSHWLRTCSEHGDCGDDEVCACGVCTVKCKTGATCGDHASCEGVGERNACGDAPAAVNKVCLAVCSRDDDCAASGIACADGACVGVASLLHAPDASTSASDAAGALPDAEAPDAEVPDAEVPDAEVRGAQASVDAGDGGNVSRDCLDAVACKGDLLCHIDDTCIARNTPDDDGIATLAVGRELSDRPSFNAIPAFVVTADAVIWIDAGTYDETGMHRHDATVFRLGLADDGAPEVLADDLAAGVAGMAVDETSVYFTTADGIWSVRLDGSTPAFHLVERLEDEQSPWILDGGFVYYVNTARDGFLRRVALDGSEDVVVWNMADPLRALAAYNGHIYEELFTPGETDSYLTQVDGVGPDSLEANVASHFRSQSDLGPLLVSGSVLLADVSERNGLQTLDLQSNRFGTIAADASLDLRSVTDGDVYYVETADSGDRDKPDYFIGRVAVGGGATKRLRHATGPVGHVVAAGDQLYWVEDRRLLSKPLE
jgi:hypothetical protein